MAADADATRAVPRRGRAPDAPAPTMSQAERDNNVIPFPSDPGAWQEDIAVVVPEPLPRIPPGEYQAVAVGLRRYEAWKRPRMRLDFDVFQGDIGDGVRLARLAWDCIWMPKPRPSSTLGRFLTLARLQPAHGRPVSLRPLMHKMFRVQVVTVTTDKRQRPLPVELQYSKVAAILGTL